MGDGLLALSIIGLCSTWTYNILWMQEVQRAITLLEFAKVGFTGSALVGSLASDFWVSSTAAALFVLIEGRRIRIPRSWVYVVLTLTVAGAFGFPLFLFMRERLLHARAAAPVSSFSALSVIGLCASWQPCVGTPASLSSLCPRAASNTDGFELTPLSSLHASRGATSAAMKQSQRGTAAV